MIMRELFGRIAYDAYCESRGWKSVRGEPLPQWKDQSENLRESWMKAADAVIAAYKAEYL
jgi:hypothetical protein